MEHQINNNNDTICAISTAPGVGGIAVIRISGNNALSIIKKIWNGKDLSSVASHSAHLGHIIDANGEIIDEVVATIFIAPRTFTGEDVIEISCHGSIWIQQQILKLLIDNGCRMATGGEFTQRAFLNGRIDLSQAEAIADVIACSSRASHRIAISQMRGAFSRQLADLREQLLTFVSLMELELDFSEEEVEFADRSRLISLASHIEEIISRLADSFSIGNAIKNGIPVAIVGETNVGKSTLLNALLQEERALVSNIHGTTRDVIEDTITVGGTLFRFIDTAGIRHTDDIIENMGIERTFKKLNEASIALWVIDATSQIDEIKQMYSQIEKTLLDKTLICVINKIDTISNSKLSEITNTIATITPQKTTTVSISAKNGTAIDTLQNALIDAAHLPQNDSNEVIVTNARHYAALTKATEAIRRAIDGLNNQISGDFVSQDIRETMHYLGEITGEITPADILTSIFSHFCIGK
ncbi:MAG: tRNA uridine-5-carboxymethylaminomethyl(34) synthesis GTPase MnmE [Muribaculaceae bacterium]|nr:tRNA uridine-5-carboxymethylaminomethyl(34) synthesis GTPase MnmE [Muribaculaceae bacterium]